MKRGKPKKKKFAQKKEKIKKVVKNISFWHRVKNIEEKHTLLFFLIVGIETDLLPVITKSGSSMLFD